MTDNSDNNNTLRIGVRDLDALLDKIERNQSDASNPNREFVRWQFRVVHVDLTIEHNTGSKVVLPVATRNISRGGISLLHSSFVYPGSRCHVSATLDDGSILDMAGVVSRCNHLGGKVHEVGIKFDSEISTKDLLGLDPMQEAYSLERIDPEGLHGTVLIVCGGDLDQQLLIKLLESTSLAISVGEDGQSAVKRAQKGCDLVLVDSQVGDESGADILMALRSQGIDAPVLIMSSDSSSDVRDEMRMAGASGLITKPFTQDRLHQALAEFLLADGDSGPLYTTLGEHEPAYEILGKFLGDLPRMILTLEKSLRDADSDSCLSICRSLASTASPLGFGPVGELAVVAERALTRGSGVRDAAADIRQLIIACRRIKSKPREAA